MSETYEKPSEHTYTIYSKSGCHYCNKAKKLIEKENPHVIDCDEYLIEDKAGFLAFINEMTANKMTANEMTANEMTANEMTANEMTANEMTANEMTANEMTGNKMTANEIKTFPIIFYKNQFIGGYAELATFYEKQSAFDF